VRDAAFPGVEGYALDAAAGEDAGDGVAEFVKGDDKHLFRFHSLLATHTFIHIP
jgi:hypothetical protein